jgi:hypothetical protein
MELVCRYQIGGRIEALKLLGHLNDWLADHISKRHRLCQNADAGMR